jgi:radical SAM superfamily enzyme YgiQ (UPF0313 family)
MPHVTFVYPSVGRFPETRYVRSWQMQPLSIGVLSALTPGTWQRSFFDDRLEPIDYGLPTDLAAISIETFSARRGYQIADEYRRRGVPVILGGYHATFCPDEAQQHAEAVCIGEAEGVWEHILRDAEGGRLSGTYRNETCTSPAGQKPDRTIFQGKQYLKIALVETGRGCPFRCSFCSVTAFHAGTYRRRPVVDVVEEVRRQREKTFFFVDDNVVGDAENARELFAALAPLKIRWMGQASVNVARDEKLLDLMAASGCAGLLVGFESFSRETLATVGKGVNRPADYKTAILALRKRGISVYGTFMFGMPGDSSKTLDDAVAFARDNKLYLCAFNHIVPFPGTPLYRTFADEGRLMHDRWWLSTGYRFGQAPYYPQGMSPTQLEQLCLQARRDFYRTGSILERGRDLSANCRDFQKAVFFFGLNLLMRKELGQKYGLPLGLQDSPKSRSRFVRGFMARTGDDADLRDTCWKMPMPGRIQVAYVREPSFFEALRVEGHYSDVVTGRDTETGRIVGIGSRSIKPAFINGEQEQLGYLSTLRLLEDYRYGTLLARGYRLIRESHGDGRAKLYLSTILESNEAAKQLIAAGRGGLPAYHDIGRFQAMAISLDQRPKAHRNRDVEVRPATRDDLPDLVRFWRGEGRLKQFFPAYSADDFSDHGLLRGLDPSDVLMAVSGGQAVGTAAAWDQKSFRQSVVTGYSTALGALRPLYNGLASLLKYPQLPAPGSCLDYCHLSLVCIKDDDKDIFEALLAGITRESRSRYSFMMAGFHERHPLLPALRRYHHFAYPSRLYVVSWEDGEADFQRLDNRVPYVEMGAL